MGLLEINLKQVTTFDSKNVLPENVLNHEFCIGHLSRNGAKLLRAWQSFIKCCIP